MSQYSSIGDTLDHKAKVATLLGSVIDELIQRMMLHDNSKFREPELSGYDALGVALQGVAYGTPEYFAAIEANKPAVAHHYAANRHHPEYHPAGVNDMTLIDLLEMVCDWEAAAQRRAGHAHPQLPALVTRFQIDPQLRQILLNTLDVLVPELAPDPPQ